jgi:ubiquitin C-terminal hydrolase
MGEVGHGSSSVEIGTIMYLVHRRWWKVWCAYVGLDTSVINPWQTFAGCCEPDDQGVTNQEPLTENDIALSWSRTLSLQPSWSARPGPMDHRPLIDVFLPNDLHCLRVAVPCQDIVVLPACLWDILHLLYGGGPALPRQIIGSSPSHEIAERPRLQLELESTCVWISCLRECQITGKKEEGEEQRVYRPFFWWKPLHMSRMHTLGDVRHFAMQVLTTTSIASNIDELQRTRLWMENVDDVTTEDNERQWILLLNGEDNNEYTNKMLMQDLGPCEGWRFVIEAQKEDGTWAWDAALPKERGASQPHGLGVEAATNLLYHRASIKTDHRESKFAVGEVIDIADEDGVWMLGTVFRIKGPDHLIVIQFRAGKHVWYEDLNCVEQKDRVAPRGHFTSCSPVICMLERAMAGKQEQIDVNASMTVPLLVDERTSPLEACLMVPLMRVSMSSCAVVPYFQAPVAPIHVEIVIDNSETEMEDSQEGGPASSRGMSDDHKAVELSLRPRGNKMKIVSVPAKNVSSMKRTYPLADTRNTFWKGACGLTNLGLTCFLNSAIQCLSHAPLLRSYFCSHRYLRDLSDGNPFSTGGDVAREFARLLTAMWSGEHAAVVPKQFRVAMARHRDQFAAIAQHDVQEFMATLLDILHEDVNQATDRKYIEALDAGDRNDQEIAAESWARHLKRNRSTIYDLFQGQLRSKVGCPNCEASNTTFDAFTDLSVAIPSQDTTIARVVLSTLPSFKTQANSSPQADLFFSDNFETALWKNFGSIGVYGSSIIQYAFLLDRTETFGKVKEVLSPLCGIPANKIRLVEIYRHRIVAWLEDEEEVGNMREEESFIAAFESSLSSKSENSVQEDVVGETVRHHQDQGPNEDQKQNHHVLNMSEGTHPKYGSEKGSGDKNESAENSKHLTEIGAKEETDEGKSFLSAETKKVNVKPLSAPEPLLLQIVHRKYVGNQKEATNQNLRKVSRQVFFGLPFLLTLDRSKTCSAVLRMVLRYAITTFSRHASGIDEGDEGGIDEGDEGDGRDSLKKNVKKDDVEDDGSESVLFFGSPNSKPPVDKGCDDQDHVPAIEDEDPAFTGLFKVKLVSVEDLAGIEAGELPDSEVTIWHYLKSIKRPAICIEWSEDAATVCAVIEKRMLPKMHPSCVEVAAKMKPEVTPKLSDCLKLYTQPEVLGEREEWVCEKCKHKGAPSKKIDLWRLPDILVMHLKRFRHSTRWTEKIKTMVDCPVSGLDLSEFVSANEATHGLDWTYDLFAVANHLGEDGKGHYTANCRHSDNAPSTGYPCHIEKDNLWLCFDDHCVSRIFPDKAVSEDAYLLLYQKRTLSSKNLVNLSV